MNDRPRVSKHDHFARYVADVERSTAWYQDILGLEPVHVAQWWGDGAHFLGHGDAQIALFQKSDGEKYSSRGMPLANHQAYRLSRDEYERFKAFLAERGISYRESDHTISHSIYFQDPDDYWIELTTYDVSNACGEREGRSTFRKGSARRSLSCLLFR